MKSTIVKFLSALVMVSAVSSASAGDKDILMYIGSKSSGRTAANSAIIAEGLKARGYNVDYKLLGNCGPVKEILEKGTDKTLVTMWSNDWQAGKTCNIAVKKEQFVETVYTNPYSVCVRNVEGGWKWQAGKTYKIATNPVDSDSKVLGPLGDKLGVKFEAVQYKNSGAIKKAFLGGEVDLFYAAVGPEMVRANKATCLYTTAEPGANGKFLGAEWLYTALPGNIINAKKAFISWVMVDSKFDAAGTAQLKKDISEILADKEIQASIEKQGSLQIKGSIDNQLKAVAELTETMK